MPLELWGEAVNTSVYILNRSPSKSLQRAIPYEKWTGRKPCVENLRVFGSIVHVKAIGEKLKNLDDRSKPMVFISYAKGSKAYVL